MTTSPSEAATSSTSAVVGAPRARPFAVSPEASPEAARLAARLVCRLSAASRRTFSRSSKRSSVCPSKVPVSAVENLAERSIRPKELLADTNYGFTKNAIECEKRGTELVAPVPGPKVDEVPAANGEGAITKADFDIDPKGERRDRCPAGQEATSEKRDPETGKVRAFFDGGVCESCPHRDSCPAKMLRGGRAAPDLRAGASFGPPFTRRSVMMVSNVSSGSDRVTSMQSPLNNVAHS